MTDTTTFAIESIALNDLTHLDLRLAAAALQYPPDAVSPTRDEIAEILAGVSTEEPFFPHPALAYRIRIFDEATAAEALVSTRYDRVGIAWGADADWGDLWVNVDLTTEAGGDLFLAALWTAIDDYLNTPSEWESRR